MYTHIYTPCYGTYYILPVDGHQYVCVRVSQRLVDIVLCILQLRTPYCSVLCSANLVTGNTIQNLQKHLCCSFIFEMSDPSAPCGKIRVFKRASTNTKSANTVFCGYGMCRKHYEKQKKCKQIGIHYHPDWIAMGLLLGFLHVCAW